MNVKILDSKNIKSIIGKNTKDLIGLGKDRIIIGNLSQNGFVTKSAIQSAIMSRSESSFFDNIIKPAIILDSINSEISTPGSGDMALDISSRIIDELYGKVENYCSIKEYEKKYDNIFNFCIKEIRKLGHKPFKKDFQRFINQEIKDPFIKNIIKTSFDLSASRRDISCEVSNIFETEISVEMGHKFPIRPYPGFVKGKWIKRNPIVLVIDGAVIEVSEIHHFLEKCNQENIPGVILCRSISPDVLNTLFVNRSRGTLDIIPFEISIEDETLNMLKDICVVSGSKMISSDMGDLISTSVRKGLNTVSSVEISETYIKIFNEKTEKEVKDHLSFLRNKRDQSAQEIQPYIDKRIHSMISDCVKISVGQNQIIKNKLSIEIIDTFLRSSSVFFKTGCINLVEFEKILKKKMEKSDKIEKIQIRCIIDAIKHQEKKITSVGALVSCIKSSFSTASSIISAGIILAEDSR